jgi:ethanolamine utilization cobalamin adenosyltransferase
MNKSVEQEALEMTVIDQALTWLKAQEEEVAAQKSAELIFKESTSIPQRNEAYAMAKYATYTTIEAQSLLVQATHRLALCRDQSASSKP